MGNLIEYHIPSKFVAHRNKWVPSEERGRILEFPGSTVVQTDKQSVSMALEYTRVAVAPPR